MSELNIFQKMVEVRKTVTEQGLNKDKKGFNYSYVTGDQILAKMVSKMNELNLLLIPSSNVGDFNKYDYKNSKGQEKTEFQVKGQMTYTWINADKPEETFTSTWAYYGQQDDISKAYGSGLTYSERYYLLKFFGIPTDYDDPDLKNYGNKQQPVQKNKNNTTPKNAKETEEKQAIYNDIVAMIDIKKKANAKVNWNEQLLRHIQEKYKKSKLGDLTLEQINELRNIVATW